MNSNTPPLPYKAYSRASLTTAKTRQLVMLYDGVIRNLMQAQRAIANHNPEQRFERLMKASEIVMTLQASVDLTRESELAQGLFDYYTSLDSDIIRQLSHQDSAALEAIIDDVRSMRKAWDDIDNAGAANSATSAANTSHELSA